MYTSILALLCRSLRADVRSRGAHLIRIVLLAAIYLSLIQIQLTGAWIGAPGLNFFSSIVWLNLIFLTLTGIGAFSNSITEEKEEDALGLLKMAGVDSIGLLLGKIGGRLFQAMAFLIVQYPFALLSITMGGVGIHQIRAAYFALAAYLLMLAGIGVFCSTISNTSRGAARLMVVFLIFYCGVPTICSASASAIAQSGMTPLFLPAIRLLSNSCIFLQTSEIMATSFQSPLLIIQVVSNVLGGLIGFTLSWALFDRCTRNPASEPATRGFVTYKTTGLRLCNPGRPRSNAIAWKDFHFATGGIVGLLVRFGCYTVLFLAMASFNLYLWPPFRFSNVCTFYTMSLLFLVPLDASFLISRSLQDEVRGQTIPALVMLPGSVPVLIYSKLAGSLLGLLPGMMYLVFAFFSSEIYWEFLRNFDWRADSIGLFATGTIYAIGFMVLLPHLTAVIALAVPWGAMPLALGAMYAIYFVEMILFGLIAFVLLQHNSPEVYLALPGILNLLLCVACHFEAIRRFKKLAEK